MLASHLSMIIQLQTSSFASAGGLILCLLTSRLIASHLSLTYLHHFLTGPSSGQCDMKKSEFYEGSSFFLGGTPEWLTYLSLGCSLQLRRVDPSRTPLYQVIYVSFWATWGLTSDVIGGARLSSQVCRRHSLYSNTLSSWLNSAISSH